MAADSLSLVEESQGLDEGGAHSRQDGSSLRIGLNQRAVQLSTMAPAFESMLQGGLVRRDLGLSGTGSRQGVCGHESGTVGLGEGDYKSSQNACFALEFRTGLTMPGGRTVLRP